MDELVVDASVVAKWYLPERHHELAWALRDEYLDGRHDLAAPALLPFEVANALKYSGHYDGDRLVEAAASLPEYGLRQVPFRNAGLVTTVANDADVTIYDASYVALAHSLDTTVYTTDSGLLDSLEGSRFEGVAAHLTKYPEAL